MTFREASDDRWSKKYHKFFGCDSPKVIEYRNEHTTLEKGIEWINEAKEYSINHTKEYEAAFLLCFCVIEPMALKYFWMFLGPDTRSRKIRIDNGDFEIYLGMVYETLPKILKSFKPETYDSLESLCKGLQWWSRGYLKEATVVENASRAEAGEDYNSSLLGNKSKITKIERPDQAEEGGRGWDRIDDEIGLYSSVDDQDFEVCDYTNFMKWEDIEFDNWECVEQYLDIIKTKFDSAVVFEQGTENYVIFSNNQIHLTNDKPDIRRIDEKFFIMC